MKKNLFVKLCVAMLVMLFNNVAVAANPSVSLVSPGGNISVVAGSKLYVKVNATDSDGTISQVRLYKNGVKLARNEGGAPYEWSASGQNDPELQNLTAGSFTLRAEATDNTGAIGTSKTITVTVNAVVPPPPPPTTAVNDAQFVMSEVPTSVAPGASFTAKVTYLNTGSTTWTATAGHKLGSQSPQDNTIWGSNRTNLTVTVEPGESYTFVVPCKAPSTAGTYNFQRRMVQEGVQWFGEVSLNKTINVTNGTVTPPPSGSTVYKNYTKLSRDQGTSKSFSNVDSKYLIYTESWGRTGHNNISMTQNTNKAPRIVGAQLMNVGGGQDKFIALYRINSSNITVHVTGGAAAVLFVKTGNTVTLVKPRSLDPSIGSERVKGPAKSNEVVVYAEDEGGKDGRDEFFMPKASHTFGGGDDLLYIFKFGDLSPNNTSGPNGNGAVGTLVFN